MSRYTEHYQFVPVNDCWYMVHILKDFEFDIIPGRDFNAFSADDSFPVIRLKKGDRGKVVAMGQGFGFVLFDRYPGIAVRLSRNE